MSDDRRQQEGLELRRRVLGEEAIARSLAVEPEFMRAFQELANENYASVWGRTAELPLKLRTLVTVAILSALGTEPELRLHLHGAARAGWTREEIGEVFLHTTLYAGAPRGQHAMALALEVFAEREREQGDADGRAADA
jgi:alkylhydroperoxidase/carboxymuconolactone decarboxylase family protein YurZ